MKKAKRAEINFLQIFHKKDKLLLSSRVLWLLTSPSPSFLDSTGICQDCSSCTKHERDDTKIHSLLESLDSENSNQNRRSAALLGLPYFMKEDPSNFIKFCEEIMDIGGGTCPARAHGLRNKLLQRTI
ncbi:dITP/XTP pyrophosphatase [Dissostichus eleginoides]|uniref:DITP/XTP pyrophosphatase n=1 Tax=Dissostichus eleginoides TaxID=100907 RepID=A0AAD9C0U6_DISEL|nr:dITP/XTP pyrophosphatase [Dissostichus eleginoides]